MEENTETTVTEVKQKVTSSLVGSLRHTWRSKLRLRSFITCSQGNHIMSPKHLQAIFRAVICTKEIGAQSALSSSGTTSMANGEAKVAKERIEAVEPDKNLITFRDVIEGDLMKEYKSFVITIQVTPKHGGPGSIVDWHLEYEKLSDEVAHPETLLQFGVEVCKEIDEHLLSEE